MLMNEIITIITHTQSETLLLDNAPVYMQKLVHGHCWQADFFCFILFDLSHMFFTLAFLEFLPSLSLCVCDDNNGVRVHKKRI